jgi:alpha/beta superfamily hydrolase
MKIQQADRRILFIVFLLLSVSQVLFGQGYSGNWDVRFTANKRRLNFVLHIKERVDGQYSVTLDVPFQKAFNLPATEVQSDDKSMIVLFKAFALRITLFPDDAKHLKGTWNQGGPNIPFDAKKISEVTETKRPTRTQTPVPPFPYNSEDIEYDNLDKTIHFGATFSYPKDSDKRRRYPTVLLITGSGGQDRDETMFEHKPFAVLADYLTRNGFAVLRVDDREVGKTTGSFLSSTTEDFKNDAVASLEYLKKREEVDTMQLGLLGHSEGGLIAAMIASERKDIAYVVLLGSPVVDPIDLIQAQTTSRLVSQGVSEEKALEFQPFMKKMVMLLTATSDTIEAYKKVESAFIEWQSQVSKSTVKSTTGINDEKSMQRYIRQGVIAWNLPWNKYYMSLHPRNYYKNMSTKVLALYGEKDIQVDPVANVQLLEKLTSNQTSKSLEVKVIPKLNHLFQHCRKCNLAEYAEIEETISPEVLSTIVNWLKINTGSQL